ncbi:MAG: acetylornithine transaminase [Bordetella sp.]|nr:MAG: acetylornithine transaminase [Bordetella sp.]
MKFNKFNTDSLMNITSRPDLVFINGKGSWLQDNLGKWYLDFIQGWAVNSLGHCPPEIEKALISQSKKLINPSPAFYNLPAIELASRLVRTSCFDRVFFANSGAEANEGAIKLARKWGKINRRGAYKIITMTKSFHGRTLATMAASDKISLEKIFSPKVDGFIKGEINNLDSIVELIDSDTVAIMIEPIQGEAGVIPANKEFMQNLRKISNKYNLLLIVDEIQTGMARTGTMFAYEQSDIIPDIMTLGKGIGGGVPLAALLAREEICVFEQGDQGGTYNGNPLCTAVGIAIFDVLNTLSFMSSIKDRGNQLSKGLMNLSKKWNLQGERGTGLLRALILNSNDNALKIVEIARNIEPEGLLLNAPNKHSIRFMPALNIQEHIISLMLEKLDYAIKQSRNS